MIKRVELISDEEYCDATDDTKIYISHLHQKLNYIRVLYNKPMIINSGFRSNKKHLDIYKAINASRKEQKLEPVSVPWGSAHLKGAAADIHDPFATLQKWVMQNFELVELLALHFEDFEATPGWVHVQVIPPRSGKTIFIP